MIARCLDVELHSLVPFLIDGFVFAMPGSGAHESHCAPSCLRGKMPYPRKKRIDRYGLRLEQVQRVVAICVELEAVKMLKTKMSQHFFPGSRPGCDWPFFRSYRRSAILFIFARSFFTQEEFDPLWLFLFLSGHENEPLGLLSFHKRNPPKSF